MEKAATQYFSVMAYGNFLYPLGAVLSAFFLVQNKTRIILKATFLSCGLNFGLDFFLILGIPGKIPSLEGFGAALGAVFSQGVFCAFLLQQFLTPFNRKFFKTGDWILDFSLLRRYLRIGMPRMWTRVFIFLIWLMITRIMTVKGGDYLLILSVGSTITFFFLFYTDAITQATTTLASQYLGRGNPHHVQVLQAGVITSLILSGCLAIPLLGFPDWILSFFFSLSVPQETQYSLKLTLGWVWLWISTIGILNAFLGVIFAHKETFFCMMAVMSMCSLSLITIYGAINIFQVTPDKMWVILCFENVALFMVYAWRLRQKNFYAAESFRST